MLFCPSDLLIYKGIVIFFCSLVTLFIYNYTVAILHLDIVSKHRRVCLKRFYRKIYFFKIFCCDAL